MFRKSAVAAALFFISVSPDTYALGLGDINMQSALNQPMAAVINLTSAAGTDLSEIKVTLASREAHQRAGLSRARILSDFRFKLDTGSNGQPVVRITSHDAIHEPFLEFMLQLEWSNGRLLRQYTVLVDPPVTIPAAAAVPVAPVARAPAPAPATTNAAPRPTAAPPATTSPARSVTVPEAAPVADSYGPIRRSDTLWGIAKQLRPDESITMDQMMLALQRANPQAFMGDNINRMKAGVTLKVPERSDIVSMSPREATAETRRQYAEWKAPREVARQEQPAAEPVVDTTTEAAAEAVAETSPEEATTAAAEPAPEADVAVTTEAHLQLVAPEDVAVEGAATAGDPGTAVASPDDASTLSQQLALVSEEAEANRAQSQELQSRVDELEQQIVTMKRLLELKNEELASMQQARSESAVEAEPAAEPEAAVVADADRNAATEEPRGIVNRLMDNPVLAGLGVLVAIVLGGILWVSTRQKNKHGLFDDEMTFNDQLAQGEDTGKAEPVVPVMTDIGEYKEPAPEPPAVSNQQEQPAGDPLTEADVYLAYGRIQQAEDVLQAALQNNPEDNTLRSKLLQVYHQAGNAAAFDSLASDFRGSVSGDDDEWLKIAAMGYELSPGNALYGAAGDAESATEFDMDLSGMEDLLEDVSLAENQPDMKDQHEDVTLTEDELPESIEFNLDDIVNETVNIDELEDESEGLLDSSDEVTTKLDLARAYIDMGDPEGARSILSEVMEEGSDDQKREADTIISQLA